MSSSFSLPLDSLFFIRQNEFCKNQFFKNPFSKNEFFKCICKFIKWVFHCVYREKLPTTEKSVPTAKTARQFMSLCVPARSHELGVRNDHIRLHTRDSAVEGERWGDWRARAGAFLLLGVAPAGRKAGEGGVPVRPIAKTCVRCVASLSLTHTRDTRRAVARAGRVCALCSGSVPVCALRTATVRRRCGDSTHERNEGVSIYHRF